MTFSERERDRYMMFRGGGGGAKRERRRRLIQEKETQRGKEKETHA